MGSILQTWVAELGLRHQGVLVSSIRGCDTVRRDHHVKLLCRCLRAAILNPHCGDAAKSASYIQKVDANELLSRMNLVVKDHDDLPHHYIMHLMHAAEIIGYKQPDIQAAMWRGFYMSMCNKLHLHPELESELDSRLDADEKTFASNQ